MSVTRAEWLRSFAAMLGTDAPSEAEGEDLLALAGVAAHASDRTAAPLSCWLAARAGLEPAAALALARRLAEQLEPPPEAPPVP